MKFVFLLLVGIAFGVTVSGGMISIIASLRIIPRLATFTNSVSHVFLYESALLLGAAIGNLHALVHLPLWRVLSPAISALLLLFFGIFAGMFVGLLAIALAETLNILPIFMRRMQLVYGSGLLLIALALGKFAGTLAQYYFGWIPKP